MKNDSGIDIIRSLAQLQSSVSQNWPDPIGQSYSQWFEKAQNSIAQMENSRQEISSKVEQIKSICEEIIGSSESTKIKTKSLKR